MKRLVNVTVLGALLSAQAAFASDVPLEKKLDDLHIPSDRVSSLVSEDKLHVVNKRYSSLVNRHELTFMAGNNFTPDSHLSTQQLGLTYRYHINSRVSLGFRYQEYFNELNSSGEKLFNERRVFPDTDFALESMEGFVNINTIYGKMRFSQTNVVYFDQYVALGAGKIKQGFSQDDNLYMLDLGFAFWLGKHMSARVGARNEFYKQNQIFGGERSIHNAVGYMEIGYLFGQGS